MTDETKFKIKSYGKAELASMYIPDINPLSAAKTFKTWIEKYPGLSESLAAHGLRPLDRRYAPVHVHLIVMALGVPSSVF